MCSMLADETVVNYATSTPSLSCNISLKPVKTNTLPVMSPIAEVASLVENMDTVRR